MCCNAQKKEKRDAFQLILEHDGANDSQVARKLRVTHEANLHNKKLNVGNSSIEKKSFRDNIAAYAEKNYGYRFLCGELPFPHLTSLLAGAR